jgi:hypothetical protein
MWVLMLLQLYNIRLWSFGTSRWMTRQVLPNTVKECVTFIFLWNVKNHLLYDAASHPRWLSVILKPYISPRKQDSAINCRSITELSCIITKKEMGKYHICQYCHSLQHGLTSRKDVTSEMQWLGFLTVFLRYFSNIFTIRALNDHFHITFGQQTFKKFLSDAT